MDRLYQTVCVVPSVGYIFYTLMMKYSMSLSAIVRADWCFEFSARTNGSIEREAESYVRLKKPRLNVCISSVYPIDFIKPSILLL